MDNNENRQPQSILKDYLDRLEVSVGANRDTEGLGTMAVGPFIMGSVDAINGEGGREVPEFVATRHELKQLAAYWAEERLVQDDAIVSFRKRYPKITDEDWRVFTTGSEEEQEVWRNKVFGEEEGAQGAEQQ